MKKILALLLVAVLSAGCGKKKVAAPADKYADPAFKAAQRKKAIAAYEELVQSYPDSEFANQAKRRLQIIKQ